jgi:AraC family transcriptional regulator, regulatory protein of adaptative response / methylated-DNA-[protein]-cysteine methyltransferase
MRWRALFFSPAVECRVTFSVDGDSRIERVNELKTGLSAGEMAAAWERRDPEFDGLFVFGVKTTGIFCRPSCPSQPRRENVMFFQNVGDAVAAGYRPCKRCKPEFANGKPPEWIGPLLERAGDERISAAKMREFGIAPERARRWFQRNYGMTFAAWQRGLRLSRAFTDIRRGAPLDDVILSNGFESHSGFRAAFSKTFGTAPGLARKNDECLKAALLDTPIGPMLAVVSDRAVVQLEFADRRGLEASYAQMKKRFGVVVPGENDVLKELRAQLTEYFAGERKNFSVAVDLNGTDFQKKVWIELMLIPYGQTRSYTEVAKAAGKPGAVRAVARANATNRLYLLVPCHRVIGHDGRLSGYGGGLARKQRLLELERLSVIKTPVDIQQSRRRFRDER